MAHKEDLLIISVDEIHNEPIYFDTKLYLNRRTSFFHRDGLIIVHPNDISNINMNVLFMDNILYPNRRTHFDHYDKLVMVFGNELNNVFPERI